MGRNQIELPVIVNALAGRIASRSDCRQEICEAATSDAVSCRLYEMTDRRKDAVPYRDILHRRPPFVVVAGGDGTLHQTLTGLRRAAGKIEQPLPAILVAPIGTMNVIAGQCGHTEEAVGARLRRALGRHEAGELLPGPTLRTLEVNGEVGFIYGCGLVYDLMRRYYAGCGNAWSRVTAVFGQVMMPWNKTESYFMSADLSVGRDVSFRNWPAFTGILAGTVTEVGFGIPMLRQDSIADDAFLMRVSNLTVRQMATRLNDLRQGHPLDETQDMALGEAVMSFAKPQPYLVDGDLKENGGITHILRMGPTVTLLD